jgi:hypothetical protein
MRSRLTLGLGSTEETPLGLKMMNRVIAEMRTCPNGFEPERPRNTRRLSFAPERPEGS